MNCPSSSLNITGTVLSYCQLSVDPLIYLPIRIFLIFEQHSSQQLETILAAKVVSMNSNLNFVRRLIIDMCDSFSIILLKSPQDSAVSPNFPESKNRFLI